jgi:hypothetical protein
VTGRGIRSLVKPGYAGDRPYALLAAGIAGWAAFVFVAGRYLVISAEQATAQPYFVYLDWHVYMAGAEQLIDRTLYRAPLTDAGVTLPVPIFNLPMLSAALAVPFLALPSAYAAAVWQLTSAAALALSAVLLGRLHGSGWGPAAHHAGIGLGIYVSLGGLLLRDELAFWWALVLGNNSYVVLALVAGFATSYRAGHDRASGVLLALAVGLKLWPVALMPFVLRERRWRVAGWFAGAVAVQLLVTLAWLGGDILPQMLRALQVSDAGGYVFGLIALATVFDWWPEWGSAVVALILISLPLRGNRGIGAGVLSGLCLVPNLWGHYFPAAVFGCVLILHRPRGPTPDGPPSSSVRRA